MSDQKQAKLLERKCLFSRGSGSRKIPEESPPRSVVRCRALPLRPSGCYPAPLYLPPTARPIPIRHRSPATSREPAADRPVPPAPARLRPRLCWPMPVPQQCLPASTSAAASDIDPAWPRLRASKSRIARRPDSDRKPSAFADRLCPQHFLRIGGGQVIVFVSLGEVFQLGVDGAVDLRHLVAQLRQLGIAFAELGAQPRILHAQFGLLRTQHLQSGLGNAEAINSGLPEPAMR